MKFCEYCGAELEENAKFCPKCGHAVDDGKNNSLQNSLSKQENSQSNSSNINKRREKGHKGIIAIIIILVILVIGSILALCIMGIIRFGFLDGILDIAKPTENSSQISTETIYTTENSLNNTDITESINNLIDDNSSNDENVKPLDIKSLSESSQDVTPVEIETISGKISSEDEKKQYELKSANAGTYRFEFSDIPQNVNFNLTLYNSDMEELTSSSDCSNGDGVTYDLDANTKYNIIIEQNYNTGSYTLNIGSQASTVQIKMDNTVINKINDKISFTNQKNIYEVTSENAGTYRFEFSDIPQNINFKITLYNSDMEQLDYSSDCENGNGITYDLDENTKYYIVVEQNYNVGSYALNLNPAKDTTDISNYSEIADSIQYINQKNIYTFTPSKSSNYQFTLSANDDLSAKIYLYNADMEQLAEEYSNIQYDLEAGEQYYIAVEQDSEIGKYSIYIN